MKNRHMQTVTADLAAQQESAETPDRCRHDRAPCTYPHICRGGRAGTVVSISQAGRLGLRAMIGCVTLWTFP